jgi:hypothetical protein
MRSRNKKIAIVQQKLLSFIDVKKLGVEVGPSHNPICPKSEGYNVEIIDHLSRNDLRIKYADHGVLSAIEPVDHVWRGESYAALTGKMHGYGWVIASHVIEHAPDLIRFLQGCDDILEDSCVLALAIPDKRYCFDHLRPRSSLAAIIDAYEAKRTTHSVGTAAEYFLYVCEIKLGLPWSAATAASLRLIHTRDDALSGMEALRNSGFLDLHAWCFTPLEAPHAEMMSVVPMFPIRLRMQYARGFFLATGERFPAIQRPLFARRFSATFRNHGSHV